MLLIFKKKKSLIKIAMKPLDIYMTFKIRMNSLDFAVLCIKIVNRISSKLS